MRILIAEDEPVSRRLLETTLHKWGYDVVVTADGRSALRALQAADAPRLAVLDWMMPEMDGVEVCRQLRAELRRVPTYIILLTAKVGKESTVAGLDGGADDYITKPFDRDELRARLQVGRRMLELQRSLADRVHELEEALAQVKTLQGLLPICCYCKKIRDDHNYWQQVEGYIAARSAVNFSHAICPDCWHTEVEPQLQTAQEESVNVKTVSAPDWKPALNHQEV